MMVSFRSNALTLPPECKPTPSPESRLMCVFPVHMMAENSLTGSENTVSEQESFCNLNCRLFSLRLLGLCCSDVRRK